MRPYSQSFERTLKNARIQLFSWHELHPTFRVMIESLKRYRLSLFLSCPLAGPDQDDGEGADGPERGVATKVRPKTKKPSMYRVLLMNDDYTPMEFVVSILMSIFNKTQEEATQIMLNVHQNGVGVCGVYTFEIAETKVSQVMDAAKRRQHPLQCTLEKA